MMKFKGIFTVAVLFASVSAHATVKTWCKWLFVGNDNPLEWLDSKKIVLSNKEKAEVLRGEKSELGDLLEMADGVHYFKLEIHVEERPEFIRTFKEFEKVSINRLTRNSSLGRPIDEVQRRSLFGQNGGIITIKEKNPDAILYAIHVAKKIDPSSKIRWNSHEIRRTFSPDGLMQKESQAIYDALPDHENVVFRAALRWNKPHFEYIVRKFESFPGLKIKDPYFNRHQPMGYVEIEGSKGDVERVFESGYAEIMQLENSSKLCKKYPDLCGK
jgi:hypothetical protein